MKCVVCRQGETEPGTTTITLSRDGTTVVVKGVPARVCDNCGEDYIDEEITDELLRFAEEAVSRGVEIDVSQYVA